MGDACAAQALRGWQRQSRPLGQESSTGSIDSQKVKLSLAINVVRVDFDPEGGSLRVSGTIASEHEQPAESAVLVVPASRGWLLAARRTRDTLLGRSGPNERLCQGSVGRPKPPILRRPTRRREGLRLGSHHTLKPWAGGVATAHM